MKKLGFLGICATAVLTVMGCASTSVEDLGRFTIISSKNINFSKLSEMTRSPEKVATQSFNAKGIFIKDNTLSEGYVMENALDSALEQIPGAVALVDAKVQYFHMKKFGKEQWGYKFEGTALIDDSAIGKVDFDNKDIFFISSASGEKITFLTEKEFDMFCNGVEFLDM